MDVGDFIRSKTMQRKSEAQIYMVREGENNNMVILPFILFNIKNKGIKLIHSVKYHFLFMMTAMKTKIHLLLYKSHLCFMLQNQHKLHVLRSTMDANNVNQCSLVSKYLSMSFELTQRQSPSMYKLRSNQQFDTTFIYFQY